MKVSFGTAAVIEFDTANEYLVFDKDKNPSGWVVEFASKRPISSTLLSEIMKNKSSIDIEYDDGKIFCCKGYSVAAIETMFHANNLPITMLKLTKGMENDNDVT